MWSTFVVMRGFLACCFFCTCTFSGMAQVPGRTYIDELQPVAPPQHQQELSGSLKLAPVFPHKMEQWRHQPELLELTIINPSEHSGDVELTVIIATANGNVIARSRDFTPPILTIASGTTRYTAADIFERLEFDAWNGNEKLPVFIDALSEGKYVLCLEIKAKDRTNKLPPLPKLCHGFSIVNLSQPELGLPILTWNADSTWLETLTFRWHYPTEVKAGQWLLRIVQASSDTPEPRTMEHEPVVFERVASNSTMFELSSPTSYLKPGVRYLWSVRVYEQYSNAVPVWATPNEFMISDKK